MTKANEGPFKRATPKISQDFSIHAPWVGGALALIALTQLPIAIKTSLDLICMPQIKDTNSQQLSWCKKNKS